MKTIFFTLSSFVYLFLIIISTISAQNVQRDSLLIDFGNVISPAPWNNVTETTMEVIDDLINSDGTQSGIGLRIFDAFNGINTAGTTTPDPSIGFPATATGDSFFGNTAIFADRIEPTGGVELFKLKPGKSYEISIFSSRIATDNRETQFLIEGKTSTTVMHNTSSNESVVSVASMQAADDGTIKITASPGPNNNNASGFFYIGAMHITYEKEKPIDSLLVDFGNILSPAPWNNVTETTMEVITDLINSKGKDSGIGLRIFDAFNGINTAGTTTPDPSIGFPASATGDSFFGNTAVFADRIEPTGGVELFKLKPGKSYEISIFSSRIATDNRETQYLIEGKTSTAVMHNTSSNESIVSVASIEAADDGTIRITASPGPNNNNGSGFFYLGAMHIIYEGEETSSTQSLSLTRPNGGEFWQVGKEPTITWESKNVTEVKLEYSIDNGDNWLEIASVPGVQQKYKWKIPNTPSEKCRVRITGDNTAKISKDEFEISTDNTNCPIVILGSSTAAGSGASVPDSSWVNRYASYLNFNTKYNVTNLAFGGYTTYHILPTGTAIPQGVNINIDQSRNITKALESSPYAIIVNMPSNDAANNFSVADQMKNFDLIIATAKAKGSKTWICTSQPRNFTNPGQISIQKELRDSVFARYGDFSIDFWNGIELAPSGTIDPIYNVGDGVHLNNRGHKLLFDRVVAKSIDTFSCNISTNVKDIPNGLRNDVKIYPNPSFGNFYLDIDTPSGSKITINTYNLLGSMIHSQVFGAQASGKQTYNVQLPDSYLNQPQYLILKIEVENTKNKYYHSLPLILR